MKRKILYLALLSTITFYSQTQIGTDIDGEAIADWLGKGISLSTDGNILAVGSYGDDTNGLRAGVVRVYENIGGTWTQIGADIYGEAEFDDSGIAIALSSVGDIVAIGAPGNDGNGAAASGHVRIYENIGGAWTKIGSDIDGEAVVDYSGETIALSSDGDIVAIGAPNNDSGYVRVYENIGGTWTQIGINIDGEATNDRSGHSVSLSSDGKIIAIGAPYNAGNNGSYSGHVRIYENIGGTWTKIGADIDGEAADDVSGWSVSLSSDGSIVTIGAPYNDGNGAGSGHVRIYENNLGDWIQIGSDIDGEAADDLSGWSVSLSSDGKIIAIGAPNNGTEVYGSGHVRVYENIGGAWTQIGADIDGEAVGDSSSRGLALSSDGSVVAIGTHLNDENGYETGHVRVYDLSDILSVADEIVNRNFSVYPNPTSSKFQIALNSSLELKSVSLLNSLGQEVLKSTKEVLDVSGFSTGVYYLKIETDKGIGIKKVVVK